MKAAVIYHPQNANTMEELKAFHHAAQRQGIPCSIKVLQSDSDDKIEFDGPDTAYCALVMYLYMVGCRLASVERTVLDDNKWGKLLFLLGDLGYESNRIIDTMLDMVRLDFVRHVSTSIIGLSTKTLLRRETHIIQTDSLS